MEKINYDYLTITLIIVIFIGCILTETETGTKTKSPTEIEKNINMFGDISDNMINSIYNKKTYIQNKTNQIITNLYSKTPEKNNNIDIKQKIALDNDEYNENLLPSDEITLLNGNINISNDDICNDKIDFDDYYTSNNPYIVKSTFVLY